MRTVDSATFCLSVKSTFFEKCLGISHDKANKIAVRTKLQDYVRSPAKSQLPGYNPKEPQTDQAIAFWTLFFGDYAQTSGDGNRYFPVNTSYYYLYFNTFWPWWLEQKGYLKDDSLELNPNANIELAEAIAPLPPACDWQDVEGVFERAEEEMKGEEGDFDILSRHDDRLGRGPRQDVPGRHRPPPVRPLAPGQPKIPGLPEDLEQLIAEHPDLAEDAQMNSQVMEDLKILQKEVGFPSFATFLRARHDIQFANVKSREKHFHCRCHTCERIQNLLHRALMNQTDRAVYEKERKAHYFEVKHWRRLEVEYHAKARSTPDQVTVLSYDDTGAMGFPRMTNRPVKSIPTDRVNFVPWNLTNHGTKENIYVYDLKNKWYHGGNRLCTNLYHVIRRIKLKDDATCTPLEKSQKVCRKLGLMGDNVSENKNHTILCFCQELIERGWYDEIEMLFGPVGHTHNGNDANHYVHNQLVGNFVSITPAEFFQNYAHAWHDETTRPTPIIAECQYNFDQRYAPHQNRITNFTNRGQKDPNYVRAFRFFKNAGNVVEMVIKGSPSSKVWYGENSVAGAPGFRMLTSLPAGPPKLNRPNKVVYPDAYLNGIKSAKLTEFCRNHERLEMQEHLIRIAETWTVPSQKLTLEDWQALPLFRKKAVIGYGPVEVIGVRPRHWYIVPFLRPDAAVLENFWSLPGLNNAGPMAEPQMPANVDPVPPPIVSYTNRKPAASKAPATRKTVPKGPKQPAKKKRKRKVVVIEDEEEKEQPEVPFLADDPQVLASEGAGKQEIPSSWAEALGTALTDAHVGSFAVIETVYDMDRYYRGIGLVQVVLAVCVFCGLAAETIFFFNFFLLIACLDQGNHHGWQAEGCRVDDHL